MKRLFLMVLIIMILSGITANTVWAQDAYRSIANQLIVKDGSTIFKIYRSVDNPYELEDYHASNQNVIWEWYTPEEFEYEIMIARDPTKEIGYYRPPEYGPASYLSFSMALSAERDMAKLQQTLKDIKKGIKVSKPVRITITTDGLYPDRSSNVTNFVGWAHWYVYGYTFTDKAGKEVDLGIYETRGALFNALKFYCDKEVRAERMTKREANRMYKGLAHDVRNCDEVSLTDKLVYYKKLYEPYLWKPIN